MDEISTSVFLRMVGTHLEDRDGVGLRLAAVALVDRDELLVEQRRVVPRPLSRGLGLLHLPKGSGLGEGGWGSEARGEAGCTVGGATRGKAPRMAQGVGGARCARGGNLMWMRRAPLSSA